ncbi:MAG TPA: ribonuclease E/G, partial [Thermoanaerobaculia bacterium]|nr:ribonuclease E/G [Thermoanaerobaculia bacterium]
IVLDFIDMEEPDNREQVFAALEQEIRKDRSKTKILQISEFGLVEMTRKRVRQSLERSLTQACTYCGGTGRIKSNTTVILTIWRQLMKLKDLQREQELIVRVNPGIYQSLQGENARIFEEVESLHGIHLVFKPDETLHHEQFDLMTV